MTKQSKPLNESSPAATLQNIPFSSNAIRLSLSDWFIVLAVCAILLTIVPALWDRIEKTANPIDFRLPYQLGEDYWSFSRDCRQFSQGRETLVIGDSVIWGHYVPAEQTLSHYLNQIHGGQNFVNLGVDGIHPAALSGLLRYYGKAISHKNIILHFNPLWLSSAQHDLQAHKEFSFNHPKLVPQFFPRIPSYRETFSNRLGIAASRHLPFSGWVNHLHITCFDGLDIPSWTIEHPYQNPLTEITLGSSISDDDFKYDQISWYDRDISKRDLEWVELATSFQWYCFKKSIEVLQKRDNRVFIVVGPFNEHLLNEKSLFVYQEIKVKIETWFRHNEIDYYIPLLLPSEYYADASHPLGEGYAMLAEQLYANESFASEILNSPVPGLENR